MEERVKTEEGKKPAWMEEREKRDNPAPLIEPEKPKAKPAKEKE